MTRRTYHDPLHGEIVLDNAEPAEAMAMALIDAPAFQRLRPIPHPGPPFPTFPGAQSPPRHAAYCCHARDINRRGLSNTLKIGQVRQLGAMH